MAFLILLLGLAVGLLYGFGFAAGAIIGLAVGYSASAIMFAVRAKRALDQFQAEFVQQFEVSDEALDQLIADLEAGNAMMFTPEQVFVEAEDGTVTRMSDEEPHIWHAEDYSDDELRGRGVSEEGIKHLRRSTGESA